MYTRSDVSVINRESDFNQTLTNNPSLVTRVNDKITILFSPERDFISFPESSNLICKQFLNGNKNI